MVRTLEHLCRTRIAQVAHYLLQRTYLIAGLNRFYLCCLDALLPKLCCVCRLQSCPLLLCYVARLFCRQGLSRFACRLACMACSALSIGESVQLFAQLLRDLSFLARQFCVLLGEAFDCLRDKRKGVNPPPLTHTHKHTTG